jgi:hypothetical protein
MRGPLAGRFKPAAGIFCVARKGFAVLAWLVTYSLRIFGCEGNHSSIVLIINRNSFVYVYTAVALDYPMSSTKFKILEPIPLQKVYLIKYS